MKKEEDWKYIKPTPFVPPALRTKYSNKSSGTIQMNEVNLISPNKKTEKFPKYFTLKKTQNSSIYLQRQ